MNIFTYLGPSSQSSRIGAAFPRGRSPSPPRFPIQPWRRAVPTELAGRSSLGSAELPGPDRVRLPRHCRGRGPEVCPSLWPAVLQFQITPSFTVEARPLGLCMHARAPTDALSSLSRRKIWSGVISQTTPLVFFTSGNLEATGTHQTA